MPNVVALLNHNFSDDASTVALTFQGAVGDQIQITIRTEHLDGIINALTNAREEAQGKHTAPQAPRSFRGLKNWAVGPHPDEDVVLLILDRETPLQTNFALGASTAEELAAALISKSGVIKARPKPN